MKEKLDLLNRIPEPAIERAARTLLNLRESWEGATKEEREELARMMIQEVGVDVAAKHVIWVKARPDFEVLFHLLDKLRVDEQRRFRIEQPSGANKNINDAREDFGQNGMDSQCLVKRRGDLEMKGKRLKSEIAQRTLNDLWRKPSAH